MGSNLALYLESSGYEVYKPKRNEIPNPDHNLGNVIYAIGLTGDFREHPFETVNAHVSAFSKRFQFSKFDSFCYLSSTRVYGTLNEGRIVRESDYLNVIPNMDSLYDISKLLGESLCLSFSNPTSRVIRLSNVYGIGQSSNTFLGSVIKSLNDNGEVTINEGINSSKDYISIDDVVKQIENIVLKGKHRVYNLASGLQITHEELIRKLEIITKRKILISPFGITRAFPQIDISRLVNEFNFIPRNLLDDLHKFFINQN